MPLVKIKVESGSEDIGIKQDANQARQTLINKEQQRQATISLFTHSMINESKKIINYSISNIGNLTGDYIKQENVQTKMGYIQDIITIGLGFKAGPVAGLIAVAGVALSKGMEISSYFIEQKHKEIERAYLMERSGNATINNSRGTED